MTKLIAEIGWNHMGNISIAKKMIKSAKDNGADFVKTQIFDTKFLAPGPWDKDGRKNIYKKAQLTKKKYGYLQQYSKKIGIKLFSSVVNKKGVDLLKNFQRNLVKIPSAHNRDYELIEYSLKYFKKVIISLGATNLKDIKKIISISKNKKYKNKLILLHCVSVYPCNFNEINIKKIDVLKNYFNQIGFSDHTENIYASVLALKYEPLFIEKHFTISKKLPGRDNKISILPEELREIKKYILISKKLQKFKGFNFLKKEKIIRDVYSKRWVN